MKHKKIETQQGWETKEEWNKPFVFFLGGGWVVGLSLGKTLPGTKGKKHYETSAFVSFCLFIGVFLGKTNNNNNNNNDDDDDDNNNNNNNKEKKNKNKQKNTNNNNNNKTPT